MITQSWRSWGWRWCSAWLAIGGALARVVVLSPIACLGDGALAQITPDPTLGSDNSTVTSTGSVDQINGGATRGANLFHSFQEFNVKEGRAAVFTNPAGIENILSRVTGANPSYILGTLGISGGNANLFLINPNGIIFGPNARLDVGGSFVGTTANAIGLANGDIFSANSAAPLPSQLLNVNPNAFFFNQLAAQPVINRSTAGSAGLEVPQGRSSLLVGGDVRLEGGRLQAPGGRVELGGLASPGSIGLSMNGSLLSLSFPDDGQRADVYLTNSGSNTARVNVAASNGGSIAINARNIDISGESIVDGGLETNSGFPGATAGEITLNATEEIAIANSSINNRVETGSVGKGGNIDITTGSLKVTSGGELNTSIVGQGNAGNVNVNARNTISFVGESPNHVSSRVYTRVENKGKGQAGDIYIKTGSLLVSDGGVLAASTFGIGDAGNVTIDARDTVSFIGTGPYDSFPSGVYTQVGNKNARGDAGDIYISTGSLFVRGGGYLNARTFGRGDAGNVTINARDQVSVDGVGTNKLSSRVFSRVEKDARGRAGDIYISTGSLFVTGGAYLSAGTLGIGDAGNVTINARDLVSVDGVGTNELAGVGTIEISSGVYGQPRLPNSEGQGGNVNITTGSLFVTNGAVISSSTYSQENAGNVTINARDLVSFDGVGRNGQSSGAYSQVEKDAGGNGGSVNITTGLLSVTNGAELIVSSFGQGGAGDLIINARNTVRLDNHSRIGATTIVGNKGNISLRSQNLVLRRSSDITTNATRTATGGNITIVADIIAALENSDISANAEESSGGRIKIDAQGIFGTQFREAETLESDITASSRFGVDGVVEINTLDVDPNRGLVNLPAQPIATEMVQACTPGGSQANSEFVVTGRGGLPPTPSEALSSDAIQVDWVTLNPGVENSSSPAQTTNLTAPAPLVEAQGWVMGANGEVILTALAPTVTPHSPWRTPATCRE